MSNTLEWYSDTERGPKMEQENYSVGPEELLKVYIKRAAELQHQLIMFEASFLQLREELEELKKQRGGDNNG